MRNACCWTGRRRWSRSCLQATAVAGHHVRAAPAVVGRAQGAGSSYSSGWHYNYFFKDGIGHDTTVTFIDNVSYGWHDTVRGTDYLDDVRALVRLAMSRRTLRFA